MGEINGEPSVAGKAGECDCSKFLETIQLILDDEATNEEVCFFKGHLDGCNGCFEHYNIEKSVIDEIRTKIERRCCPETLKTAILDKIQEM